MRKEEVYPAGFKVYDDNDVLVGYACGYLDDGFVYKNEDAFNDNPDEVCYLCEGMFDVEDEGDSREFVPVEKAEELGDTRNTIKDQIRDLYAEEYMLTDEQLEACTKCVFNELNWSCVYTQIAESFWLDDLIDFSYSMLNENVFTKHQYEAVMDGKTPEEYAGRSLSYSELSEFENEFEKAFVVDHDCPDDWSESGLGENARITYVEERRTGAISGPEEFDCPERWRR